MGEYLPGHLVESLVPAAGTAWAQLVLATPIVLWGGWPFFARGWQSIVNRSLNMFTLIALGVGVAYVYSLIATAFPGLFPSSFRMENGQVGVYFEAAAVIVTLVLLGQVMELRAAVRPAQPSARCWARAEDGEATPRRRQGRRRSAGSSHAR
jgi:Cu+-exporting ATPase